MNGMKHLIIIGVGGFAREVYWHAQESIGYGTEWDIKGFLDGDVKLPNAEYEKIALPLLGDINTYIAYKNDVFICAIGMPAIRKKIIEKIQIKKWEFMNLIHKTAKIQGNTKIGIGNIMCPYTHINDGAVMGNHVVLNKGAGLGHDSKAGDYSCFMGNAGLMGYAQAGKCVYFADGAAALPHSVVEDNAYIGCRSVVFKHVKKGKKVFGNPARELDF